MAVRHRRLKSARFHPGDAKPVCWWLTQCVHDRGGRPDDRERLRFLAPRALAFAVLVALPVAVALAWVARRFALGQAEQLAVLFVAVLAVRFGLRPVVAPYFTHPADRDGED